MNGFAAKAEQIDQLDQQSLAAQGVDMMIRRPSFMPRELP